MLALGVLLFGMAGTLVELLLLAHYEDTEQLIPLALLGGGLVIGFWHAVRPGRGSVRAMQVAMVLFLCAGAAGIAYHYLGAAEFQLEIDPAQSPLDVFAKVLRVHAPPLLAPGVMVQLGLLGLVATYRHPALTGGGPSLRSAS
jgi:hypothetical protein